jgi:F0F1-type ATP synthase assembly protein I
MSQKATDEIKKGTSYSAGALEMGLSVVIGMTIGYWLDEVLGTAPWMAIFWMTCGSVAGFRSLWRLAKRMEREAEAEEALKNGGSGDDELSG